LIMQITADEANYRKIIENLSERETPEREKRQRRGAQGGGAGKPYVLEGFEVC